MRPVGRWGRGRIKPDLAANLRTYIRSFSPNMLEVIEKFDFDNTITKLDDSGLLFQVMEWFGNVDLHPDRVPNSTMGTVFEELIRKFNEALGRDQPHGRHLPLRPGGEPGDVRHLQGGPLHQEQRREGRREHPLRQHALLGDKRRELSGEDREAILRLLEAYEEDAERSKVFPSREFGFRKVRVEQP